MTKKRILIIDDEASFTRLLKLNLEYNGHCVLHEENVGPRGVATIKQFKPDLILLDVMMPGIDGGQIPSGCKAIRCSSASRSFF